MYKRQVTALFKKEKKATGVSLPETLELSVGDVEQLNAAVTPSDASDKCTYTTEQTDIISVSKKGEVEALKAGTAQIKVTCGADVYKRQERIQVLAETGSKKAVVTDEKYDDHNPHCDIVIQMKEKSQTDSSRHQ